MRGLYNMFLHPHLFFSCTYCGFSFVLLMVFFLLANLKHFVCGFVLQMDNVQYETFFLFFLLSVFYLLQNNMRISPNRIHNIWDKGCVIKRKLYSGFFFYRNDYLIILGLAGRKLLVDLLYWPYRTYPLDIVQYVSLTFNNEQQKVLRGIKINTNEKTNYHFNVGVTIFLVVYLYAFRLFSEIRGKDYLPTVFSINMRTVELKII